MTTFRLLLVVQLVVLTIYTVIVGVDHGWNFFPAYFGVLALFDWPGQFTADFTIFLILAGLWTAWRGHFTGRAIARGFLAMGLGTGFIASYLLFLSWKERGDMPRMLVGDRIGSAH